MSAMKHHYHEQMTRPQDHYDVEEMIVSQMIDEVAELAATNKDVFSKLMIRIAGYVRGE